MKPQAHDGSPAPKGPARKRARRATPGRRNGTLRLSVSATVQDAPELLARAAAGTADDMVVDCADTERCDVAALQIILALRAALGRQGKTLTITNIRDAIRWRFDYVGLTASESGITSVGPAV